MERWAGGLRLPAGDAEDPQLQGQGGVVADQRRQLDQGPLAERGDRGGVLIVVQVGRDPDTDQGPDHLVRDPLLLVGEPGVRAHAERLDLRLGQARVAADRLVRGPLVAAVLRLRDDQDRHLADPGRQVRPEPDGRAQLLQGAADLRRVEHRVERAGQAARTTGEQDRARPLPARAAEDLPVQADLLGRHFVGRQDRKAHGTPKPRIRRFRGTGTAPFP